MKCEIAACAEPATVHILAVKDRRLAGERHVCERHSWSEQPFCDPRGPLTNVGRGLGGAVNTFDLCYIVFDDSRQADGLVLREMSGTKQFSIPVFRHQAHAIREALASASSLRPFTFAAFANILRSTGIRVSEVIVDRLEMDGQYYHAKIKVRQGSQTVLIDARPSDAFGLALACGAPILIADVVFATAVKLGWTGVPADGEGKKTCQDPI